MGVATIGCFAADRLALLLFLHVEAEEFERLVAVYPAVPRMRVRKWLMTWRRRSKASIVSDTPGEVGERHEARQQDGRQAPRGAKWISLEVERPGRVP